jgi:hypothetical protein
MFRRLNLKFLSRRFSSPAMTSDHSHMIEGPGLTSLERNTWSSTAMVGAGVFLVGGGLYWYSISRMKAVSATCMLFVELLNYVI